MGKTFENLTWEELCDLMCGEPEDDPKPLRQTDNVRTSKRCYEPTKYYISETGHIQKPTCVYLEDGECTLLACVRKGD